MAATQPLTDTLHEVTHRVPGVPAHAERSTGHQGANRHGRTAQAGTLERRSTSRTRTHAPARPPRVLVAWQRRIAALFGQEL
ncbi:hypothetical protein ACFVAJ_20695 [Agromyces sp. NPDC057679]|uniref:hypothetical protein n=1 Tax=Agromyces sp. NPDC057679 TaxID=3346207 RepID=UPI00366B4799